MKIRKKEKKSNNALGGGLACSGHFCPILSLGIFCNESWSVHVRSNTPRFYDLKFLTHSPRVDNHLKVVFH